jgi:hypothetical protein
MAALTRVPHQALEHLYATGLSADTDAFALMGGLYGVTVDATFGGGSVTLQHLAADNTTYITCLTAFSAAGYATVSLPPGSYKVAIVTATVVQIDITAIARAA